MFNSRVADVICKIDRAERLKEADERRAARVAQATRHNRLLAGGWLLHL